MGLNGSSDEWCRQSDIIIAGFPYAMKIVDDTIIWAATESARRTCFYCTAEMRRQQYHNIQEEIQAGKQYTVRRTYHLGWQHPPLREFKKPENIKELRSFLGLVAQFGACLLYTSPSPRDRQKSRMPSSA